MTTAEMTAAKRVRVMKRIGEREGAWTTSIAGIVGRAAERPTGSWLAGGKGDKRWLNRLLLKKDDGEPVLVSLDEGALAGLTRIRVVKRCGQFPSKSATKAGISAGSA